MPETVTKDELMAAIDEVPPEKFETLHQFIKSLASASTTPKISRESFMKRMQKIPIKAPPDFSRNMDLYLSGEKTID